METLLKYVSDKNEAPDTQIISLPSLPAGSANIGYVAVAGNVDLAPLPASSNTIGNVRITGEIPTGSNTIGNVTVSSGLAVNNFPATQNVALQNALPTGSNNIGIVDIASIPNVTLANIPSNQAITVSNAISTAVTSLPALPAGTNAIGNVNVSNFTSIAGVGNTNIVLADSFTSLQSSVWDISVGAGDIVQVDGNTLGCHYLVISKDPTVAGTDTTVTSKATFNAPCDISAGMTLSKRQFGYDCNMQMVSTEDSVNFPDIEVSNIMGGGGTYTFTTTTAHGLSIGDRIAVRGCTDERLNFPAMIVNTVPSVNRITAIQGPDGGLGTIAAAFNPSAGTCYIVRRPTISNVPNGASLAFESSNPAFATMYSVDGIGRAAPLTTTYGLNANTTFITTTANAAVNAIGQYAFQPAAEYRIQHLGDQVVFLDNAIDTQSYVLRGRRYQVLPDTSKDYKLRFAARSTPSVPIVLPIVRADNSSIGLIITTEIAHGLGSSSAAVSIGYGHNSLVMPVLVNVAVTSILNSVQFTVSNGSSSGTISYGGIFYQLKGASNVSVSNTMVPSPAHWFTSVSRTSNLVTLFTNSSFVSSALVGEYANLIGFYNSVGTKLGIDGAYRLREVTATYIVCEPLTSNLIGLPDIPSTTNIGGSICRRCDFRIHFARVTKAGRQRLEHSSLATGMMVQGMLPVNTSAATINPVLIGGADSSGVLRRLLTDVNGAPTVSMPPAVTDIVSANFTGTPTTVLISGITNQIDYSVLLTNTAISGSSTYDLTIQESDDGTNWYNVYDFPRMTSTSNSVFRSPRLNFSGRFIQYVQTLGGGGGITRALVRSPFATIATGGAIRQLINRTIDLYTPSSTTTTLFTPNCGRFQLICAVTGTASSAGVLQLQGSDDQASWSILGTLNTPTTATATAATFANVSALFVRAVTQSAPTAGLTLNYVMIKGS